MSADARSRLIAQDDVRRPDVKARLAVLHSKRIDRLTEMSLQAQAGRVEERFEKTGMSAVAERSAVVALYDTHREAEEAVRELQKSGFDMRNCLSSARTTSRKKTWWATQTRRNSDSAEQLTDAHVTRLEQPKPRSQAAAASSSCRVHVRTACLRNRPPDEGRAGSLEPQMSVASS